MTKLKFFLGLIIGMLTGVPSLGFWKLWNSAPVSSEIDTLCRTLLEEAGVPNVDTVKIKTWPGCPDAAVIGPTLVVNEQFLQSLPYEQQRFVLGHEAIHIKNNHFHKAFAFFILLAPIQPFIQECFYNAYTKLINKVSHQKTKDFLNSNITKGVMHGLVFITTFVVPLIAYKWMIELEATREGVQALNCLEGGLAYCVPNDCNCTTIMESIRKSLRWLFYRLYHPPISWHAAEIKKLM